MNNIVPDRIGMFDDMDQVDCVDERRRHRRGSRGECSALCHTSMAALRPLHDRVLVRRDAARERTAGGIVIPDRAREKTLTGTVIAVGPGTEWADGVFRKTQIKPGDRVVFSLSVNVPYADLVEDGELVMMAERDILGVLAL